jgi:RNA polymerase sigma-70 factor, ECF subfamily
VTDVAATIPQLVDRARANDCVAQAAIYEEFATRICSHAYRMVGSRQDAEDITQETFVRAFRSIGQLKDQDKLSSWLYSIASNLCLDHLRRRKLISWLPWPEHETERQESFDPITNIGENDLVRRALKELPHKDAVCLALRSIEGFSCGEIAEMLKCSEAAVWNRLARARAKFAVSYRRIQTEEAS